MVIFPLKMVIFPFWAPVNPEFSMAMAPWRGIEAGHGDRWAPGGAGIGDGGEGGEAVWLGIS